MYGLVDGGLIWSAEVEAKVRKNATNLDPQERPKEIQICTRCVVTNQRPRIVFDEDGVCSACRYAERQKNEIDWAARGNELHVLLNRHRKSAGYDVIVPCSGGKDSSMVAHRLKHEYGMNPLCIKWAPFMYTDIGRRNFESFIHSGFDALVAYPNGIIHRKLARLAFEYYGDPFQPFIYGQLAWPMRAAVAFNVPLVFGGENGEALYGGDPSADDKHGWDTVDWARVYLKGAGVKQLVHIGHELGAFDGAEMRQLSDFYSLPPGDDLQGVEYHWMSYYRPWWPMDNFYYSSEHTGFEPNEERSEGTYTKMSSLDDKMDGLHYWTGFLKFGIGRATSDAAQQVRAGDITRDEALALVEKYDGNFPINHLEQCLEYLGMSHDQLHVIADRFRCSYLRKIGERFVWEYADFSVNSTP